MPVLHRATSDRLSAFSDGVFAVLITVVQLRPPVFHVAASALYRLDGREQTGAATGCLLCGGFFPREHDLRMLNLGAHSPKPGCGGFIDGTPNHALPIGNDIMPFRGGCVEISSGWTWNLYLLPDRLSEARSARSKEANISAIKRTRGV